MAESPASYEELRRQYLELLEKFVELQKDNVALKEEIARLKGLKGRPKIKPSGMAKEAKSASGKAEGDETPPEPRRRGAKRDRLVIDETKDLTIAAPAGSHFKGWETFIVQDVILKPHTVCYRRQCWRTPSGETILAPLPEGVRGHFGPELRRFILVQYHQAQVTVPRIVGFLRNIGTDISKRQVMRLLIEGHEAFAAEQAEVLRAGLQTASWITVDDTGARHAGKNGYCLHIGNDWFAFFATTGSKSRGNFLEQLLRAGRQGYAINPAALAYLRTRKLSETTIDLLADHEERRFADREAWMAHLERLGLVGSEVPVDPAQLATEGALWGSIVEQGLLDGTVIVSDGAGQFRVGEHALCWVHAERLIHALIPFCPEHAKAKEGIRRRIWRFYADLKEYRGNPTSPRAAQLERRFDRIFETKTGFTALDRQLERHAARKPELLAVLKRPDIPLHTNGSENDIRCQVTRRKISGGTRSDLGRQCRDVFLSLMKTCAKLEIRFWDYLAARLHVPGAPSVPFLTELIRMPAKA